MNRSFEELYQKLCDDHKAPLKELRHKLMMRYLLIIASCIFLFAVLIALFRPKGDDMEPVIVLVTILGMTLYLLSHKLLRSYIVYYKNNIIKAFVALIEPNIQYNPMVSGLENELLMEKYAPANFDLEKPNIIYMDDLMTGLIEDYQVTICDMDLSVKIGKHSHTLFTGLFTHIKTNKEIKGFIKIVRDKSLNNPLKSAKRYRLDDNEFEKHFDVRSSDRLLAMQYLTADVMKLLVDFKEKSQIKFDLYWQGKNIAIRFHTGSMFEPHIFGKSIDKETLSQYVKVLSFVMDFCRIINKTVKTTYI